MASFQIQQKQGFARCGVLQTLHGSVRTPFFMAIATKGSVKHMMPDELRALGTRVVLGNTYHLWLRPGDERIQKLGGLSSLSRWNGPMLTDSGGYQAFSLGARIGLRGGVSRVKITEEGVNFTDPINGAKHFLSPEKSIDIQLNLGSDMLMVLDVCAAYPCSRAEAFEAVERTTRWAKRSLDHFYDRVGRGLRPLLFCIVQGSLFEDLRVRSARELLSLTTTDTDGGSVTWDGFAIGGVAVGEPREKLTDVLQWVLPELPQDKPRYLMGLGRPDELVHAVSSGIDMFDCVIPTREGRHGRVFIDTLALSSPLLPHAGTSDFFQTLNLTNECHRDSLLVIQEDCDCLACKGMFTRAYMRHLMSVSEPLGAKLATAHNLRFYMRLMERLGGEIAGER